MVLVNNSLCSIFVFKNQNINNNQRKIIIFYADYLEKIIIEDDNLFENLNKEEIIDKIFHMYNKSYSIENSDFPFRRYQEILDLLSRNSV